MKVATIIVVISIFCGVYFEFLNPFAFDSRTSEQCFEKAYALGKKKKFNEAIVFLRKAILLNPDNKQALFSCKQIYRFHLGDQPKQQKIIEICSYVIKKSPGNIDAYRYLMMAYFESNEVEMALNTMREIVKLQPKNPESHLIKATAFNWTSEPVKVVNSLNYAIELAPTNAYYYVFRGNEYCKCQKYEKALADYNKALSLNPNCARDYGISFGSLQDNLRYRGYIAKSPTELSQNLSGLGLKLEGIQIAEQ